MTAGQQLSVARERLDGFTGRAEGGPPCRYRAAAVRNSIGSSGERRRYADHDGDRRQADLRGGGNERRGARPRSLRSSRPTFRPSSTKGVESEQDPTESGCAAKRPGHDRHDDRRRLQNRRSGGTEPRSSDILQGCRRRSASPVVRQDGGIDGLHGQRLRDVNGDEALRWQGVNGGVNQGLQHGERNVRRRVNHRPADGCPSAADTAGAFSREGGVRVPRWSHAVDAHRSRQLR